MDTDALIRYILQSARADNAIVIEPWPEHFKPKMRTFLDGLRPIPARITAPPGDDPFMRIIAEPGRWLFVWIPEQ